MASNGWAVKTSVENVVRPRPNSPTVNNSNRLDAGRESLRKTTIFTEKKRVFFYLVINVINGKLKFS